MKRSSFSPETRKKLGITQAQLAAMLNVSRFHLAHTESGKRILNSDANLMLANIFIQFRELESGKKLYARSGETKLFLNDKYRKILPNMKVMEQECRRKIKQLKNDLAVMKERARDTEHAIIVFSTAVRNLEDKEMQNDKTRITINGLNLFKQQAYDNLLTCWEPEQAKLHGKIEAIAGEAKALRRYRVKLMREQGLLLPQRR
jgi:transcriptional regulator with XRE-family HTH domain